MCLLSNSFIITAFCTSPPANESNNIHKLFHDLSASTGDNPLAKTSGYRCVTEDVLFHSVTPLVWVIRVGWLPTLDIFTHIFVISCNYKQE